MKPNANPAFPATRWTRVAACQRDDDPDARAALSDLCALYWFPVYAFIRSQGRSPEDAEDLTQSFFLRIIEKRVFNAADQARGKFRSFLLSSLQHFLYNAHRRDMAECRAPQRAIAFDAMAADERYLTEPRDNRSPEHLFDRRYVTALLNAAMAELREEWTESGQVAVFEALAAHLSGDDLEKTTRTDLATRLGISISEVKARRETLRRRLNAIITRRIEDTLHHPSESEIKAERDALLKVVMRFSA